MASEGKQMQDESYSKNYLNKNQELKINIIDTPGQSEYTPGLPNKYCVGKNTFLKFIIKCLGVSGYILCFSIDDAHSFEIIQHVNKILLESIGTKYVPRVIVANKTDLNARRYLHFEKT